MCGIGSTFFVALSPTCMPGNSAVKRKRMIFGKSIWTHSLQFAPGPPRAEGDIAMCKPIRHSSSSGMNSHVRQLQEETKYYSNK